MLREPYFIEQAVQRAVKRSPKIKLDLNLSGCHAERLITCLKIQHCYCGQIQNCFVQRPKGPVVFKNNTAPGAMLNFTTAPELCKIQTRLRA